jgi:hypothetical protein
MSHEEKAVEIYTKFFLKLKNIPFEERIDKAKLEADKYAEDKIYKCKDSDNHLYWECVQEYINKIKIKKTP